MNYQNKMMNSEVSYAAASFDYSSEVISSDTNETTDTTETANDTTEPLHDEPIDRMRPPSKSEGYRSRMAVSSSPSRLTRMPFEDDCDYRFMGDGAGGKAGVCCKGKGPGNCGEAKGE